MRCIFVESPVSSFYSPFVPQVLKEEVPVVETKEDDAEDDDMVNTRWQG